MPRRVDFGGASVILTAAVFAACTNAPGEPGCVSSSYPRLSFTVAPTDVDTGSSIVPPLEVTAQDYGTLETLNCFNGSVSLAIDINPTGGVLTGTTTARAVAGVATFRDVRIDKAGQNYTLKAVAPELTPEAFSSPFFTVVACAHDCWLRRSSMPTPRANPGIGVVNGILYAIGGFDGPFLYDAVEAYDPQTARWTTRAPMPTARSEFGLGVVNGILYAVGGYDAANEYKGTQSVEAYDPNTNRWTAKAPMPTARVGLSVGVVNGVLYAVGGMTLDNGGSKVVVSTVEAYDPGSNRWTSKASMATPRAFLGVGTVNGMLYAVGGESETVVEAYDPIANRWNARAPMTSAGSGVAVGVLQGVLYAVPGVTAWEGQDFVVAYDAALDTWTARSPYSFFWGRCAAGVGVVNNVLYVVGGYSYKEGMFLSDNVMYRP